MKMNDQQYIAIHEAGHAVAHHRFNIQQGVVTIVPANGNLGTASGEGIDHVRSADEAEPMVLAYCAGYAALVAAGYDDDLARNGADDDFDNAQAIIEQWELEGDLSTWQAKSVEIMSTDENRKAVDRVAKELIEREMIDADDVSLCVCITDGEMSEDEYAQIKHSFSRG